MSDKPYNKLNQIDVWLRSVGREGPEYDGVQVTIELITGFELFNTRPYHNYETFSSGYRVTGYGVEVRREDLDDAVRDFVDKVKQSSAAADRKE